MMIFISSRNSWYFVTWLHTLILNDTCPYLGCPSLFIICSFYYRCRYYQITVFFDWMNKMRGNISAFFICSSKLKSFLPHACIHLFAFAVLICYCCFSHAIIPSFIFPGFAKRKKCVPGGNLSGYLESEVQSPYAQCIVAIFKCV